MTAHLKLATLALLTLLATPAPSPDPPSNLAMAHRLRAIFGATDWKADPNKPAVRVQYFQALLATGKLTPEQQRLIYPQLANELLRSGNPTDALAALDAQSRLPGLTPPEQHTLLETRAIAYLRLAEQENCLGMHGQHSCIFPLRASAAHTMPRGAQGAIQTLTTLLQQDPHDALSRWLLNIAYMQLAQYPSRVPPQFLLPEKLFASDADIGAFLDYATPAGVDIASRAGGALIEDFDGDGLLDIVTSSSGPLDPMHLFHNNGDGTFSDWSDRAGLTHELGGLNLVLTDYDNDGHPDILVLRGGWWGKYGNYPVSLLHNRGNGAFEDVTERAGLLPAAIGPTQTAAWADYDNDGFLDLFIGYEPTNDPAASGGARPDPTTTQPQNVSSRQERPQNPSSRPEHASSRQERPQNPSSRPEHALSRQERPQDPSSLPENASSRQERPQNPSSRPEREARSGETPVFSSARAEGTSQTHPSLLFHNNGNGTFTEVAAPNGLAHQGFVKGVAWGDFNNDGRPDLYLSTHDGHNRLYRNDGPADPAHPDPTHWRFTDVTAQAGLDHLEPSFATWFFDYNNDGWPDIFVAGYFADSMQDVGRFQAGQPFQAGLPHLFRNNHDGTFTDVAHQLHLDRAILTMGANFGDLDNDGWLDIYLGTGEPSYQALLPNRMFRNRNGAGFEDITTSGGFGHLQKGHAIAFADLENRGHEDIFEEMGGAFPGDPYQAALYRNPGHPGHSVTLRLEGVRSNRPAFGARIDAIFREATPAEANHRLRHAFRTVGSVSSFGGNPFEQHIGIGSATEVEELRIRWPADPKSEQVFHHLPANQTYRIREGAPTPQPIPRHPFTLGQSPLHADALNPPSKPGGPNTP